MICFFLQIKVRKLRMTPIIDRRRCPLSHRRDAHKHRFLVRSASLVRVVAKARASDGGRGVYARVIAQL